MNVIAALRFIVDKWRDRSRTPRRPRAQGTAKKQRAALIEALRGRVTVHHRSMIKLHM